MRHPHQTTAGVLAVEAGTWLLATGFLVIAALVTLVPFILL
jgi:hypothetical protein